MPPIAKGDDDAIWVPITINLPLGFTKAFTPDNCAPVSLLFGPFSIIMLAQMAMTMLLAVFPYLVREVGGGDEREAAVHFGMLQSTLWTSQTLLAPVLGYASDRIGRRPVILLSLLVSAAGNALLSVATTISTMVVARIISGLGFQIALFRAYFADSAPKKEKAGKFGLIGVVQQFGLFAGPSIGGFIGDAFGQRQATLASSGCFVLAAMLAFVWQPDESKAESRDHASDDQDGHTRVGGVEMVKIDLSDQAASACSRGDADGASTNCVGCPAWLAENAVCRRLTKAWRLARWLGGYDLYPLLSLNFFFRFSFAAYKSVFAFFCMAMLHYEKTQVGLLLSFMGLGGMFVQGVLVRVTVRTLGEERTLFLSMVSESIGFVVLSMARGWPTLVLALVLIAVGYGLAVPCLTTLFANVPVEQGIMQGIAGFIDRFGQAFGPILGGLIYRQLGAANLMLCTGVALACISGTCLLFIGDGCAAWASQACCYSSQGYSQVAQTDIGHELSEMEAAEEDTASPHSPDPQPPIKVPTEVNGTNGLNGHTHNPTSPMMAAPARVLAPAYAMPVAHAPAAS